MGVCTRDRRKTELFLVWLNLVLLQLIIRTRKSRLSLPETDAEKFARTLEAAAGRVCQDYEEEDVVDEEPFSDQLCGRLKETLVGVETDTIRWQADVVTGKRGRGAFKARSLKKTTEEPRLGADIIMVLDVETPTTVMRKGFLAQAKRLDRGKVLDRSEHTRLLGQCQQMLSFTSSSMVFLYNKTGVHVVPAAAVIAHRDRDLWTLFTWGLRLMFFDFAVCWFGDPRLQATDRASLEGLRTLTDTKSAVRFVGRSRSDDAS